MTREEAIELIEDLDGAIEDNHGRDYDEAFRMAIKSLSDEAVQGEWVRKEKEINDCDGHRAYYWYECSVCGARPPYTRFMNENLSNFCPSCGARMKGGAE